MNHVLLLGAGFSRNWGGWLAQGVNEYLLTCREVQENGAIKDAIQRYRDSGGFEAAVAELLARFVQTRSEADLRCVQQLQSAVEIQNLLGHASPITSSRYAHLAPNQAARKAVAVLDAFNFGA
jgi:hypothetical protein